MTRAPTSAAPRLLFAWEMGEHYGHIAKMAGVIRALAGRADVWVAAADPVALWRFAPDLPARLLAAPHAQPMPPPDAAGPGASYPDVLRWCGWRDATSLAALLESWRELLTLAAPDVVIGQAAPTALLAARGGPWRTALLGSGYDAPPRATPMPPLRWWRDGEAERAAACEARVLRDANAALDRRGLPPLTAFRDALAVDLSVLAGFAELDHYGDRSRWEPDHPPYRGHLVETGVGAALDWRPGEARRILAYLRPGRAGFDQTVAALAAPAPDWDVILAAPGIARETAARLEAARVRVVDGPVRLDRLLPDCHLGVHHASNGIAAALLLAGKPQLGLPSQVEQMMCARVLSDAGLGLAVAGRFDGAVARRAIDRCLERTDIASAAAAAARRVREAGLMDPAPAIADDLMALTDG